ncbi:uncharacterized protein LY89DRAFT_743386 [Mollisia scopiformis]|uniref:Uncharacterized protein n=1 Tax=Mollisia scopiformis TaxID=149040 RepID=A0A132B403_MOLSC|nr:uncharacterized protein LY89DRAFT_743386 [Mollisia scopiformis]KUJ07061.1 hypothetical protein LY89DRAFT_743386 [Mollisia scopiformis]
MAGAALKADLSTGRSPLIDILPGEIRNQIIELCILGTLKSPRSPTSQSKKSGITVSILPRWNGPGNLRMSGIGTLPLLFVNKQLHDEVLSFVDSLVEELSIGGYILQYPNEDPRLRWNLVYSLLANRPTLQRFAPSIKVSLPRGDDELSRRHWACLGLPAPKETGPQKSLLVLQDLEQCLRKFTGCERLVVVVTVEESEPPDFRKLLPLYAYFQNRITVDITEPGFFSPNHRTRMLPWVDKWRLAWAVCISGAGG